MHLSPDKNHPSPLALLPPPPPPKKKKKIISLLTYSEQVAIYKLKVENKNY